MADRVHALRTGRSLRPPPVSGPSSRDKGKQPIRPNPQFEAYHNPWRLPESDPDEGFWSWLFTPPSKPASLSSLSPSSSSTSSSPSTKSASNKFKRYDYDGEGAYRWGYDGYDDEVSEAKGAARWLKPLALVFTVAALIAFVALVPPPSYESRGPRPNSTISSTPTLAVQSAETWSVPEPPPEEQVEVPDDADQRVFHIVHRPRE